MSEQNAVATRAGNAPATTGTQAAELVLPDKRSESVQAAEAGRVEAISALLAGAYARASTLQLAENEAKALGAPFGDDMVRAGAKGKDDLLYISHIYMSDRLNSVLGIGQWALIKRSQRAEQTADSKNKPLVRVYFDGVMLIRGSFVEEAVGVGMYHPHNPLEDFGTGIEIAMSDCLQRCCKRLGIGSQVWDKGYCDKWLSARLGGLGTEGAPKPLFTPAAPPTVTPPPEPPAPEMATEPKGETSAEGEHVIGKVEAISEKPTTKGGKRYGLKIGGEWYGTFDEKVAETARSAKTMGSTVMLTWERSADGRFTNVVGLTIPNSEPKAEELPFG